MSAVLKPIRLAIRPMRWSDVEQIAVIEQANYEFPWTARIFRDCLRVGYACRVLDGEGVPIGYGVLSAAAGEAHLLNLSLSAGWQRRGLGRRLLGHLLDEAAAAGAKRLFLEVRPSNIRARKLYRAAGFREIGCRKAYYQARDGREDALVMALDIDAAARR